MPESVSRFWDLVSHNIMSMSTGGMILRGALILCSLFATIQLLSMWGTHYGDHNASSKSFFLSLLLHCCFGLGWATVIENLPASPLPEGEVNAIPVRVTLTSEEDASEPGTSSRPVWNSSTQRVDSNLTRMQRVDQEVAAVEDPTVEKAPTAEPIVPVTPDLPARPETPVEAPSQQSVAASVAAIAARQSRELDEPTPEARPETRSVASATRQQTARETSQIDVTSRVEPQRGAAERAAPFIDDGAVLTLPTDLAPEAAIPKPVGAPNSDMIRRRSNPSPVPAEIADAGSSPSSTAATNTGDRRNGKFTRSGSKTAPETELEPNVPSRSNPSASANAVSARESLVASRPSTGTDFPDQIRRPELARPNSANSIRTPSRDPETYRARRIEQRRTAALKNGGSIDSERAVEASLKWMASIQEPAGNWSSAKHGGGAAKKDPQGQNRLDGGLYADSGITGLVVLSFLGAGYTHEEGKYSEVVMKALKWLIAQQHSNGFLGGKATRYDMMYCHAMASFALAEAYGMQADSNSFPELRDAVRSAVRLICAMQNEDGGWRYGKGGDSDMSMFGWQLMALKSAVNAGIPVPEENRRGMTKFLQSRALGTRGGLAGYKLNEGPSPAMTAEALFCRQMFGIRPRDGASQEAVTYLRQNLPRLAAYDEYYWYYGTLAMFQYDGEPWEEWNGSLRDTLVGLQRTQGPLAGSWDPNGKWAGIGGRLYSTAVSTMCLEVYYRFLRIYQSSDE